MLLVRAIIIALEAATTHANRLSYPDVGVPAVASDRIPPG